MTSPTSTATSDKNSTNVLNFSIFNSLKEAATSKAEDAKPDVFITSMHINGTAKANATINTSPKSGVSLRPNTIEVVVDPVMVNPNHLVDDSDLEEDILEDEKNDSEEIEEHIALSEILENESDPTRFQRNDDPKNEFILTICDTRNKKIICYECIVGGSCGFLSRERARVLLHIAQHFAAEEENANTENDGILIEDDEDDEPVGSHKDIDISIIPRNADGTVTQGQHYQRRGKKPSKYKQTQTQKARLLKLQAQTGGNHKIISKPAKKPIHCEWDNCSFQCDQNYKLRVHIRQVHEKVRPYLCNWPGCYGAYKTHSNLSSHRMVHTGERPFICDFPKCGAKFARKYDCERHRRIHSEKVLACEWPGCGKRLCDTYNLERHMMVHKGELPFRCPIGKCIRGFRELRYLRVHMLSTHKFLPDTDQLRIACLNSSKAISISGYNLNESKSSNGTNMMAFVNAIVASTKQLGHSTDDYIKEVYAEPKEELGEDDEVKFSPYKSSIH